MTRHFLDMLAPTLFAKWKDPISNEYKCFRLHSKTSLCQTLSLKCLWYVHIILNNHMKWITTIDKCFHLQITPQSTLLTLPHLIAFLHFSTEPDEDHYITPCSPPDDYYLDPSKTLDPPYSLAETTYFTHSEDYYLDPSRTLPVAITTDKTKPTHDIETNRKSQTYSPFPHPDNNTSETYGEFSHEFQIEIGPKEANVPHQIFLVMRGTYGIWPLIRW